MAVLPTLLLSLMCIGGCIGVILLSRATIPILDDAGYVEDLGSFVIMGPAPFVVASLIHSAAVSAGSQPSCQGRERMRAITGRATCLLSLLLILAWHVPCTSAAVEVFPGVLYKVSDSHAPIEFDFPFRAFAFYFTDDFFMVTDLDGKFQSIGFSCSPSAVNLTVKGITRNNIRGTLSLRVDAPSLTQSTTKVYVGVEGRPSEVRGCDSWSYNGGSKILTLSVTHDSTSDIEVEWKYLSAVLEGNMGIGLRLVGGMGVLVLVFSVLMGFLAGNMDVQAVIGVIGTAITISFLVMLFFMWMRAI